LLPASSTPPRASRSARLLCIAVALASGACADVPSAPLAAPATRFSSTPGFTQTVTLPLQDDGSTPNFEGLTGIVVPRTGRYRLTGTGAITVSANPATQAACPLGYNPERVGTYGAGGNNLPYNFGRILLRQRFTNGSTSRVLPFTVVDENTITYEADLTAGSEIYAFRQIPGASTICPGSAGKYLEVYLYSGSQQVTVQEISQEPDAALVLECNGAPGSASVVRGGNLKCVARTEPAGAAITNTAWTFSGPSNGPPVSGPAGQTAWEGTMAIGGTVKVTGQVNGKAQTASVAVTVTPRPWRDELPAHAFVTCPAPGVTGCHLHNPPRYDHDFGVTTILPGWRARTASVITTGPNTGWVFLAGTQRKLEFSNFRTELNAVLNDPRDPVFRGGCTASNVGAWIRAHEALHVQRMQATVNQQKMNPRLERVVEFGKERFDRQERRAEAAIRSILADFGDADHSESYGPDPCTLPTSPNPSKPPTASS